MKKIGRIRSTLIGGGNRPKGCRFPGGQRAYKYRAPFSLSDRLPIATIGEAPLACPNTQIQRLRTREEIEMEGLRPCLDVLQKKIAMESYEFEVLNEVYLQNFLHRWVVNREMNLMMLINP